MARNIFFFFSGQYQHYFFLFQCSSPTGFALCFIHAGKTRWGTNYVVGGHTTLVSRDEALLTGPPLPLTHTSRIIWRIERKAATQDRPWTPRGPTASRNILAGTNWQQDSGRGGRATSRGGGRSRGWGRGLKWEVGITREIADTQGYKLSWLGCLLLIEAWNNGHLNKLINAFTKDDRKEL